VWVDVIARKKENRLGHIHHNDVADVVRYWWMM